MSLFFSPSSSCLFSSPSPNQTSFHHTHLLSYHLSFYFYGPRPTPTSIVIAAAVKQWRPTPTSIVIAAAVKQWHRDEVQNTIEVPSCATAYGNQKQSTQADIPKQSSAFIWKETIGGYEKKGLWDKALRMYYRMQRAGINPDKLVFISVIKACGNLSDLQAGRKIHEDIIARGFELDAFVGTALASMYAKCGSVENARQLFERMPERDVASWTVIIAGYSQNGHPHEALALFKQMQVQGIKPNSVSIVSVLPACADLLALEPVKQMHSYAIRSGFDSDAIVGTRLVDIYTKCGNVNIAHKLFDRMPERDIVSWSTIIAGYYQNGYPHEALALFNAMQVQGIKPDSIAIISILPACTHLMALELGRQIHCYAIRSGFESDIRVGNAFLDLYAKCRDVNLAHKLFQTMPKQNVVSWTAIIAAYSQNDHPHEALAFFNEMQVQGIKPNSITIFSVLPACTDLLALEQGKQIHGYVIRSGLESNVMVGNALVDLYAKCWDVNIAYKLFERVPKKNVVSWTAIIAAYSQNGHPREALAFFNEMQIHGIIPDSIAIVSVLPSCAHLLALEQGKQIHGYTIRSGFDSDVVVGTALVDMYAKCGHIGIARQVFDKMSCRNVVSWNAMILAYGIHGHGEDALVLFSQMQQTGTKPDHITFTAILTACSHAGLVDQGWQYFDCMKLDYGLVPKLEHYACLVDLLGRAGNLDEAHDIIKKMPLEPGASVWGALLGACRIHCNIELGEQAAKHLFKLEPNDAGNYVLLSNMYAEARRWEDVVKLRTLMKEMGVKKQPGFSFVAVQREVHTFHVGDRTHPQSEKIYAMLETLYGQMKKAGYVPDTNLVLYDVEDEVKENMLCSHSEKLAISFGIINTSPGTPIHIMKNLRVCSDCHNATRFISKIVGREIIVRDANRFHHFKDGLCSCGNYW